MFYQKMLTTQEKLDKQIQEIQKQLKKYPKQNLICAKNGKHYKWYVSDGKHCTYLPKKERSAAVQLAKKKILTLQLQDALNERDSVNAYLNTRTPENFAEQLAKHPEFETLLSPTQPLISAESEQWILTPFEHNPKNPAGLIHKSLSGHLVRSKSEVFIDTILFRHQIPFRYECALYLGEHTLYPDFTIRHPYTGKIYYWEHFGLMDNPTYAQNTCLKLQTYTSFGIIPTINLITTYETHEHPLTTDVIEKIVQEYFL